MTHTDRKSSLIKPNIIENLFYMNELKLLFELILKSAFKETVQIIGHFPDFSFSHLSIAFEFL